MRELQLQPCELALTRGEVRVRTLLGSCVSFTMRHSETGLAAISHSLLPTQPAGRPPAANTNGRAYVDRSFDEMLEHFGRAGIQADELEVKLFGGSDVLEVLAGPRSVGQENIGMAQRLIASRGMTLMASDIGGPVGRKIKFDTKSGKVQVFKMRSAVEQEIAWGMIPQLAGQVCRLAEKG